jgi:hypothetical protein
MGVNYHKVERDMIAIDPRYKDFVGGDKVITREPQELLEKYCLEISKRFETTREFCSTVDTNSKGYIPKKGLLMYFKTLDSQIQEIEFFNILKLIDPTRSKQLKYYTMKDGLLRTFRPMVQIWLGEMLNSYDNMKPEERIGLGMVLKGDKIKNLN